MKKEILPPGDIYLGNPYGGMVHLGRFEEPGIREITHFPVAVFEISLPLSFEKAEVVASFAEGLRLVEVPSLCYVPELPTQWQRDTHQVWMPGAFLSAAVTEVRSGIFEVAFLPVYRDRDQADHVVPEGYRTFFMGHPRWIGLEWRVKEEYDLSWIWQEGIDAAVVREAVIRAFTELT